MMFGTPARVVIAGGLADSLVIPDAAIERRWLERIDLFVKSHLGSYVCGYLGFDLHRSAEPRLAKSSHPAAFLFVPESVDIVEEGILTGLSCCAENPGAKQGLGLAELPADVNIDTLCHERSRTAFIERVRRALDWIGSDPLRRITLAREVTIPRDADILQSFVCSVRRPEVTRSFYVNMPCGEIVGHSPELLAVGTPRCFSTFKLSGSALVNHCDENANVNKVVLHNPKLSHEHALSASVQRRHLLALGLVDSARTEVLSLGRLRHIVTAFTTRPGAGTSVVQCLASVLSCGASPYREGLALLSQLEEVGRGAYYGLIGVIAPDSSFEFCQVIRAYFGDKDRVWSWVGASITIGSDPDGEFEETCWKLDDCPRIFRCNVRI